MARLVYDIEADNLLTNVSAVHCVVVEDYESGVIQAYHDHETMKPRHGSVEEGIRKVRSADVVAGHNISAYDELVIDKLYPHIPKKPGQIELDTIAMSRLMYPERYQHTLESWAKTLKLPIQKTQNKEWSEFTQVILNRCIGDVRMNTMLLKYLQGVISKHKEQDGTNWISSLMTEQLVGKIHARQAVHGVMYDEQLAIQRRDEFDVIIKQLHAEIIAEAPRHLECKDLTLTKLEEYRNDPLSFHPGVKKPFLKPKKGDTERKYTTQTIKYFEETGTHDYRTVRGPYNRVSFPPLNPNNSNQLKEWLLVLGWTPDEWNTKKLDNGGFIKTSPKLTESSYGSLPEGVGQTIALYNTVRHRRSLIESKKEGGGGLGKLRPNGRVPADAITCGTPTARYTHSGAVCNIPRPSSVYGGEIRELFGVHPDHLMVGIDLSGIEARMLAHFCFPYEGGPEFAELVTAGDWHSENAELWNCTRNDAKTELYALMYGAGPLKLGNILGRTPAQGKKNKQQFLEKYGPYAEAQRAVEAEMARNDGWIRALDGRRFYVRTKKDALNTLLQGNSAIIFKHWMIEVHQMVAAHRFEQIIAYHDELQFEYYSNNRAAAKEFGTNVCRLAGEIGKKFKINVPIEAEAKVGNNWRDCH